LVHLLPPSVGCVGLPRLGFPSPNL
jgi:hypothetical protein